MNALSTYDRYQCLCLAGWSGTDCSEDQDECLEYRGTELGCQVRRGVSCGGEVRGEVSGEVSGEG